jgi:hypothetical protein
LGGFRHLRARVPSTSSQRVQTTSCLDIFDTHSSQRKPYKQKQKNNSNEYEVPRNRTRGPRLHRCGISHSVRPLYPTPPTPSISPPIPLLIPHRTLIDRSEAEATVTNPTPPKYTPKPYEPSPPSRDPPLLYSSSPDTSSSHRIVTTFPCKIQGALHCWIDGKNIGSCNATEGFVTNDWFVPVKVGDWTCTPGQYLGLL